MYKLTEKIRKRFEIQLNKIYIGNSEMKKDRPVLNQIHYTKDGHIEITNSHVGIRLTNVHDKPDSDEEFPNMDHIFRVPDSTTSIELIVKDFKELEDHLNVLYRNKIQAVRITIDKNGVGIKESKTDEVSKVFVETGIKSEIDVKDEFVFGIQSRYLHDALMFFRLIGVKGLTLHLEDNPLRPIHITSSNLHYIITPVRMGG